jgi:predicted metalloprotease with PDZ domain
MLAFVGAILIDRADLSRPDILDVIPIAQSSDGRNVSYAGLIITDVSLGSSVVTDGCAAIAEVVRGSQAEKAGLSVGDVIDGIGREKCSSPGEFDALWKLHGFRRDKPLYIHTRGTSRDYSLSWSPPQEVDLVAPRIAEPPPTFAGLTLENTPNSCGKVTFVRPGSEGEKAGILPGAVILEIRQLRCIDLEQFRKRWDRTKENTLLVQHTNGDRKYLAIKD